MQLLTGSVHSINRHHIYTLSRKFSFNCKRGIEVIHNHRYHFVLVYLYTTYRWYKLSVMFHIVSRSIASTLPALLKGKLHMQTLFYGSNHLKNAIKLRTTEPSVINQTLKGNHLW